MNRKLNSNVIGFIAIAILFGAVSFVPLHSKHIVYFGWLFLGFACIGLASYTLRKYFLARKYWIKTTGIVVEIDSQLFFASDYPSNTYSPTVKFKTNEGDEFTVQSDQGTSISDYPIGTSVNILYNPNNPKMIFIDDGRTVLMAFLFFFIGIAVVIGLFVFTVFKPEIFK